MEFPLKTSRFHSNKKKGLQFEILKSEFETGKFE